jgi:hypothetical membrane protein
MDERIYALFGVIGPLLVYIFIGISISLSPWFSWERNALSDLGHAVKSGVAPIFNFGLLLTGFFLMIYAVKVLKEYARWTGYSLVISAFSLQLVAVFDEVYDPLHSVVSILFFLSLGITSLLYAVERKSYSAVAAFTIGLILWISYWAKIYSAGVAVPETISSAAVLLWIIPSVLRIYRSRAASNNL